MNITVAIVEDDSRIRYDLEAAFRQERDITCLGSFGLGHEALENIPKLKPDVVLMDVNLPDISGIECVRQLSASSCLSNFLMLTKFQDSEVIFASLKAGASGYLLKPLTISQLLAAVRDVITGGAPLTSSIARRIVSAFHDDGDTKSSERGLSYGLSSREMEVLNCLCAGMLYKNIAIELNISYSTVRTYIERIYDKLHVQSREQAVSFIKQKMPR